MRSRAPRIFFGGEAPAPREQVRGIFPSVLHRPRVHAVSSSPPLLSGLAEIADRYDGFLLDLWGCIHDGVAPFPHVADALRRVGAAGKRRLVLSNAPRRADAVIASMTRLGVPAAVYDAVLSSGEATVQPISRRHAHPPAQRAPPPLPVS